MIKPGEGQPRFCRCECGEITAWVKLPPGSKLEDKYFGVIKGHQENYRAIYARKLTTERDIINQRRAQLLINTLEAAGFVFERIAPAGGNNA